MDIIKKFSQAKYPSMKLWLKSHWRWLIFGGLAVFIFFLLAPVIFRPWQKYPSSLRAELAWRGFVKTFSGTCREACLANRQVLAEAWRPYFSAHKAEAEKFYEQALSDPSEPELQAALVRIMAAEYGEESLPPILNNMLSDPGRDPDIKKLIVSSFPDAFSDEDWQASLRAMVVDETAIIDDRRYALKLLASFPNEANAALMKEVIIVTDDLNLLTAALDASSFWPETMIRWSDEDIANLGIAARRETKQIRWKRIWHLAGIGGEAALIQLEITARDIHLDNISRGLAANALQLEGKGIVDTPAPSSEEWQEFYENL